MTGRPVDTTTDTITVVKHVSLPGKAALSVQSVTEYGRCKDCKWWDTNGYTFEKGYGYPSDHPFRSCGLINGPIREAYHGRVPFVASYSGEAPDFLTHPDFGCVLFEAIAVQGV